MAKFGIFKETIPCGQFTWNNQKIRKLEAKKLDVADLKACINDLKDIPKMNIDRAVKLLEDNETVEFLDEGVECKIEGENSIKGIPSALVINIAKNSGLAVSHLDFVFGGSVLGVLAKKRIQSGNIFTVQRYGDIISVRRFSNYAWKTNEIGTQFERLIIDGKLDSIDDNDRNENLTKLRIADYDCKHEYSVL